MFSLLLRSKAEKGTGMIEVYISEEDKNRLKQERFNYPDVHVQKRLHALYFKALAYPHKAICELAGICSTTLEKILKLYRDKGLEAVYRVNYHTPHSELHKHRQTIEEYFRSNPPASVLDACRIIKDLTGVQRGKTQVWNFLVQIGMRPRKSGVLPGKCDTEVQEDFKKKS